MVALLKVMSMSKTLKKSEQNKYDYESEQIGTVSIDLLDAAYHTAHSYPGGVPALAVRMGMNPNTLMSKVDPNKNTHILGLKEANAIQTFAQDKNILHSMAASQNCVCIDMSACDDRTTLQEISKMISEFGESILEMQSAAADGVVTENEMSRCKKEVADLFASANAALKTLRAMMPVRGNDA